MGVGTGVVLLLLGLLVLLVLDSVAASAGLLAAGGVLSGEHGIGLEKRKFMAQQFGPDDLDHQNRLRSAFDPDGVMNPGNVLPTGASCGDVQHLDRVPDGAWV